MIAYKLVMNDIDAEPWTGEGFSSRTLDEMILLPSDRCSDGLRNLIHHGLLSPSFAARMEAGEAYECALRLQHNVELPPAVPRVSLVKSHAGVQLAFSQERETRFWQLPGVYEQLVPYQGKPHYKHLKSGSHIYYSDSAREWRQNKYFDPDGRAFAVRLPSDGLLPVGTHRWRAAASGPAASTDEWIEIHMSLIR